MKFINGPLSLGGLGIHAPWSLPFWDLVGDGRKQDSTCRSSIFCNKPSVLIFYLS